MHPPAASPWPNGNPSGTLEADRSSPLFQHLLNNFSHASFVLIVLGWLIACDSSISMCLGNCGISTAGNGGLEVMPPELPGNGNLYSDLTSGKISFKKFLEKRVHCWYAFSKPSNAP